jgi:hypothetical protein
VTATPCAWCGIAGCRDRFDECLALDFSDVRFGAVHHLTAHTYALQHRTHTDAFEAVVARFLLDHVERRPTPDAMAALRDVAGGATQVVRREPGPRPEQAWPLTVADVDTTSPEAYVATVRAWAEVVASAFVEGRA